MITLLKVPFSRDQLPLVAGFNCGTEFWEREVAEWIAEDDAATAASASAAAVAAAPARVKIIPVEGKLPTRAVLRSQEYALTDPLYLISNGQPSGRIRQFIDFVLSPAGQAIVNRYDAPIR